jgi:hypothetical protein
LFFIALIASTYILRLGNIEGALSAIETLPKNPRAQLCTPREVGPLLKIYQTDKPMIVFMCYDLSSLIRKKSNVKSEITKNKSEQVK